MTGADWQRVGFFGEMHTTPSNLTCAQLSALAPSSLLPLPSPPPPPLSSSPLPAALQGALTNCPTAEEPLPRQLAAAYAVHNPNMSAQGTAPFRAGTVQGAAWYPVLGSMQVGRRRWRRRG